MGNYNSLHINTLQQKGLKNTREAHRVVVYFSEETRVQLALFKVIDLYGLFSLYSDGKRSFREAIEKISITDLSARFKKML